MRTLLISIAITLIFVSEIYASVEFHLIEVYSFYETNDAKYVLKFKFKEIEDSKINILHIRFKPKCISRLVQSDNIEHEKKLYFEAVNKLKEQILISRELVFGLKSGKGYHPLPNKKNEFQCDNLSLLNTKNRSVVYAVHSDISDHYCE